MDLVTFLVLKTSKKAVFKRTSKYYEFLTFNSVTAFLVTIKGGGSGALAKKSAIGAFGGANNLACRQSSCIGVRKISGTWNF